MEGEILGAFGDYFTRHSGGMITFFITTIRRKHK